MKRYGFLVLSIVITFVMLANNLVLSNASNDSSLLVGATKKPARIPTKKPPTVRWVLRQAVYLGIPTQTAVGEQPGPVNSEVDVSEMEGPGVAIIAKDSELQIYHFQPSEKISVYQYDLSIGYGWPESSFTWTLTDWQELVAGADGNLRIRINNIQDTYVVIGEHTGQYSTDRGAGRIASIEPIVGNQFMSKRSLCEGSPISRLAVGSEAYAVTAIRIRQKSAASIGILGRLPAGTYFSIKEGPECRSGTTWWYGKANGIEGWVAENENETYLLEPVP